MNELNALGSGIAGNRSTLFKATPYTGTGAAQSITTSQNLEGGSLVWAKETGSTGSHGLFDTLRGVNNRLITDSSSAEDSISGVSAFNSNGFSLGTSTVYNNSGDNFIGLSWLEQAGYMDIVTYTCGGGGDTQSHNLGVAPSMMFGRIRSSSDGFYIYHSSLGNTQAVSFNSDAPANANTIYWRDTSPTSTQFTTGYGGSGETAVMYLFAEKSAYSKFGTYTGTTTISTGLTEVNAVLVKRTDAAGDWYLFYYDGGTWYHVKPNDTAARATGLISVSNGDVTLSGAASSGNGIYAAWR